MNVNFGLFPDIAVPADPAKRMKGPERGSAKRQAISERALGDLDRWLAGPVSEAAE